MIGMDAMSDKLIARMAWRIGLFTRRGMPPAAAEHLADRLYRRDHERDDRRCCIECKHRVANRTCRLAATEAERPMAERALKAARQLHVIDNLLARCAGFSFEVPV